MQHGHELNSPPGTVICDWIAEIHHHSGNLLSVTQTMTQQYLHGYQNFFHRLPWGGPSTPIRKCGRNREHVKRSSLIHRALRGRRHFADRVTHVQGTIGFPQYRRSVRRGEASRQMLFPRCRSRATQPRTAPWARIWEFSFPWLLPLRGEEGVAKGKSH